MVTKRKLKFRRGEPVSWHYRSAIGHGTIAGVASRGSTPKTTRYKVRQVDNHVSKSGSREKKLVVHTGAALHKSSKSAVKAARKRARSRKKR